MSVALVERETVFRDRVRGEGIHPWGIDEAEDLGIRGVLEQAGAQPLPVWQTYRDRLPQEPYHWADDSARGNVEHGVGHPRLQETLLTAAQMAGVQVLRGWTFSGYESSGDSLRVGLSKDEQAAFVIADALIGADGSRSSVRSLAGMEFRRDPVHHRFAGLLIDAPGLPDDAAHAGMLAGGRFFILPQGNGRARLYAALTGDRMAPVAADRSGTTLVQLVTEQLPLGMLEGVRVVGPQGIFPNADTWAEPGAGGPVALVGDAAGANDPSLGHGISIAFRDARELRSVIRQAGLSPNALAEFGRRRSRYMGTLREYGRWMARLWIEEGEEADARLAAFIDTRRQDPDIAGFGSITACGPRDLIATEAIRSRFFGGTGSVEGEV